MDLTREWGKTLSLSLSHKEGKRVVLSQREQLKRIVLVAKFLTKHALNIDEVARTICPLWRINGGFRVREMGGSLLFFVFESEHDAEKVLLGEPWSFDGHLVLLQRYDGLTPVEGSCFLESEVLDSTA